MARWWDFLFGVQGGQIAGELTPPYPSVEAQIAAAVAARDSLAIDPLAIPAIERGVELIASAVAQFTPTVYREGDPIPDPPSIIDRPSPWVTRHQFLTETVRSMVEDGDAFYFLFDHGPDGKPRGATVINWSEVQISWDEARIRRLYDWRGKRMEPGKDFLHVPLSPRAGQLHGTSPLKSNAAAIAGMWAAEAFAMGFFGGAGVPSGTLNNPNAMTKPEADLLKAQWMEAHGGPVPTPAVLSGGITYETNSVDPERGQLVQTREAGVATAARILGIPAPLLLVSIGGSSLTYQNISQLFTEFLRSTVVPLYVTPLEAALSGLVGKIEAVRFDLNELTRVDIESRYGIYKIGFDMGIFDAAGIQRIEGMRPPQDSPTIFAPVLPTVPTMPEPEETPV